MSLKPMFPTFLVIAFLRVALADTIEWSGGAVWRDCLVYQMVVDGTVVKVLVQQHYRSDVLSFPEPEAEPEWLAGVQRVSIARYTPNPSPTVTATPTKRRPPGTHKPMSGPIEVELLSKRFSGAGLTDEVQLSCRFFNHLPQMVRAFTGDIVIDDLFGRNILRVRVTINDPIPAGGSLNWEGVLDYNQFLDSHQTLRGYDLEDLVVDLDVEEIILPDGSHQKIEPTSSPTPTPHSIASSERFDDTQPIASGTRPGEFSASYSADFDLLSSLVLLLPWIVLTVSVFSDTARRRWLPGFIFGFITLVFGALTAAPYYALRPLKADETREGGLGWNVLKYFALLWTLQMAFVGLGFVILCWTLPNTGNPLAAMIATTGYVVVAAGIFGIWFVPMLAAVLVGFFLKNASFVEVGPTGPLAREALVGAASGGSPTSPGPVP